MKTGFRSLHILGKIGEEPLFKWLFFSLLAAYCLCYAPYGVNETDGGFVTGLAWQTLQGKTLYGDVVYVRPPLPVPHSSTVLPGVMAIFIRMKPMSLG